MYEIDEQQIRLWWKIFKHPNRLAEIRLLGGNGRSYSGYFKDVDTLITQMRPYLLPENERYYGKLLAYCIFNEIDESLYGREQKDKFVKGVRATNDDEMTHRNFVLIDLDPERAAGLSASDEEFQKAHLKAVEVYKYLMEQGFEEPVIAISGNGYHLYFACDMPCDEEHKTLVKQFLASLGKMFSDEDVDVDQTVLNVANLTKMMGSWAKKGSDGEDRKWRLARFVKVPDDIKVNDTSLFQKIADLLPKEEPKVEVRKPTYGEYQKKFDLVDWLEGHGIKYKETSQGASRKFELEYCPWVSSHSDQKKWDSALFLDSNGKITFNCHHSHCKDKVWQDVRKLYEPDAYTRAPYQPIYRQYRPTIPQKPKYEIKEELPELGEKWLSMSSIKKVDILNMERYKTGFVELDNSILGLNVGEVTLLSGGNASGKTSWLNTLILNVIQQHVPSALWSGELPSPILKSWIQMVAAGKRNMRESQYKSGRYYVPDNVGQKIDHWLDGKLFLYNNDYGNTWEQIFHDMQELLKVGVKLFVLDNLFSLNIDLLDGDKNSKQRELILQIKDFAKKNSTHIILVAHPRKTTGFLRKNDISGTSDLTNAVDNVFICHRVNNDFLRLGEEFFGKGSMKRFDGYGNVIEVCKNRMFGVVDLMVGMHYEMETRRFKNTEYEDIHYGWEAEPVQASFPYKEEKDEDDMSFAPPSDEESPF